MTYFNLQIFLPFKYKNFRFLLESNNFCHFDTKNQYVKGILLSFYERKNIKRKIWLLLLVFISYEDFRRWRKVAKF